MNVAKLKEHARRFADLPLMEAAVGAQCPQHDGDMSQLDELEDAVFAAAPRAPRQPVPLMPGLIERAAIRATAMIHNVAEHEIAALVAEVVA